MNFDDLTRFSLLNYLSINLLLIYLDKTWHIFSTTEKKTDSKNLKDKTWLHDRSNFDNTVVITLLRP